MTTRVLSAPSADQNLPQEPIWTWVTMTAYELESSFLLSRLEDDFGRWDYKLKFFDDTYEFRVPQGTTKAQLRALRKAKVLKRSKTAHY